MVNKDIDIKMIVLDLNETIDAKWTTKEELQALIDGDAFVRSVVQRYNLLKDKL